MKPKATQFKIELIKKGYTQNEFAKKSGLPLCWISYLAAGRFLPGEELKQKIAKCLKMEPEKLFPELYN